jgi:branched-chain amino acid transport system substrate-binding protein
VLSLFASCRACIGSLDECNAASDCSATQICESKLCVDLDSRCHTLGSSAKGAWVWGATLPLTNLDGTPHEWGPSWERVIAMTLDELNPPARLGVRGRPVRVISCDSQSKSSTAGDLAQYLIGRGVTLILTDGSADTITEAGFSIPAGALLIAGAATSPEITDLPDRVGDAGVGLVWRTTPSDAFQAQVITGELHCDGGRPSVAVLERNDAYGQGLFAAFTQGYQGCPHQAFAFTPGGDVSAALTGANNYAPDVVLTIGFPDDVLAIMNGSDGMPQLDGARWFFTQGALFAGLFQGVHTPSRLEGVIGTGPAPAPAGFAAQAWFSSQYMGRYQAAPSDIVDMSNIFDAAMLAALATHRAAATSSSPRGVDLALALTHLNERDAGIFPLDPPLFNAVTDALDRGEPVNIQGASGELDFNDVTGEAPADTEIWTVRDGGFVTVKIVSP